MERLPMMAQMYRKARYIAYSAIEPFDYIFRYVNRLSHYPPISLRRHVGPLGGFDGTGTEFTLYLSLLAGLQAKHRLWDVGCGCGLLELGLESVGWRGSLIGNDIQRPCIDWAQRTIGRRVPSFKFVHSDIYNADYWPSGRLTAAQWLDHFKEGDFDIIIAKSLFTHMLPEELGVYLQAVTERLKPGGRAMLTFFLLNQQQSLLGAENRISFTRTDPHAPYAVRLPIAPTAAVAYDESYMLGQLDRHGLHLAEPIRFGRWSGLSEGLSYQDIVLVTH